MENYLEELPGIDGVSVEIIGRDTTKLMYTITFDGLILFSGDQQSLLFYQSDCVTFDPPYNSYLINELEKGIPSFLPMILQIKTSSSDSVGGYFGLSFGFKGEYNKFLSRGEEILYFNITARSKLVYTNGEDLLNIILPGQELKIKDEIVKIIAVKSDHLVLSTYHTVGTSGEATAAFVMDNYIGIGSLSNGDNLITKVANIDWIQAVQPGDLIQIRDGSGSDQLF